MKRCFRPASRRRWLWGVLFVFGPWWCWATLSGGDTTVLLSAYYRYVLTQQVPAQLQALTAQAPADCQLPVQETLQDWVKGTQLRTREDLQRQFGPQARAQFEKFVAAYASAEEHGDAAFLANLAATSGLSPAPANYGALRRAILTSRLQPDVADASKLLSEIQTWLDLKRRRTDVPALPIWLYRGEKVIPAPSAPPTLATAEATSDAVVVTDDKPASSLDAFASLRKVRREKAQQQAQAGMQQVATEREAAEQEYGTKKLVASQAEADNMKRHAEKLAQAEKDALDQEANGWEMKIKTLVSSTITAGVGAFTGTVGAQAAQKAADHLFPPPDAKK